MVSTNSIEHNTMRTKGERSSIATDRVSDQTDSESGAVGPTMHSDHSSRTKSAAQRPRNGNFRPAAHIANAREAGAKESSISGGIRSVFARPRQPFISGHANIDAGSRSSSSFTLGLAMAIARGQAKLKVGRRAWHETISFCAQSSSFRHKDEITKSYSRSVHASGSK